jgi:hypothetical protein
VVAEGKPTEREEATVDDLAPDWGDEEGTGFWLQGAMTISLGQKYAAEARNIGWHAVEQRADWLQDLAGLRTGAQWLADQYGMDIVTIIEAHQLLETRFYDPRWPPEDRAATFIGMLVVREIRRWYTEQDPTDPEHLGFSKTAFEELGMDAP